VVCTGILVLFVSLECTLREGFLRMPKQVTLYRAEQHTDLSGVLKCHALELFRGL
jgi:threonyl-tRNA synthetase